jgi:outer membrane protein OmpA-like peptidoglycan-associated protein
MNSVQHVAMAVLVSSSWLTACAHANPQSAPAPLVPPSVPVLPPGGDVGVTAAQTPAPSVRPSDELVRRCELHFGEEEEAPKFDFDSAGLQDSDRSVLDQVVSCLTTGPLAGRSVRLIGRADPRGTEQYNFVLGGKRAGAIGEYLQANGVEAAHVAEASRGKLDSKGTDEAGWEQDRRVDIELVP